MGSKNQLISKFLLISVLLIVSSIALAQHQKLTIKRALQGSKGQMKTDSSVMVENYYYYDTSYSNHMIDRSIVKNIVTVGIDESTNIYLGNSFTADVQLRIYYPPDPEHPDDTSYTNHSFEINYDKASKYTSKRSLVFEGAQKVTVRILSVNISSYDGSNPDSLPVALMVENTMEASAEFSFSCINSVITSLSYSDSSVSNPDELHVSWSNILAADEYDLEWAYIDSTALSKYTTTDLKFQNNASRITTRNLSYSIPLMYDNGGRLYFRVRPVQTPTYDRRIEGKWSSDFSGGLGAYGFWGHQRAMNWQSSVSFAEDGKRKVVVQYFDGSLRSRQTVTKDNTSNNTIVSETFYDFQGRPVIQVLPVPTLNNIIKFTANFNVGINSGEYEKIFYDTLVNASAFCSTGAKPMDTASGASQYYSPSNPKSNIGIERFIPDAAGYPFVETSYTQDNTGRISKQGGVGNTFRTGSEHETKYFYGTPDQKELDAIFGTEVGHFSHYFKTMVRDANGQYSVSYTDMHGRTIATALAGTPPDSTKLDLLSSNTTNSITENLSDPSSVVIKDLIMESKKSLLVEKSGDHVFSYTLDPQSLKKQSCVADSICYDCLYDLRITISDDCNNQKLPGYRVFDTTIRNFSLVSQLDTFCNNDSSFNVNFTLFLQEGNYEITKQLSVSKYALDYYRDTVFLKANTCKTLQEFIEEQKSAFLNSLECVSTCQSCRDSVGTWSIFRPRYMDAAGIASVDSSLNRGQAWNAYLSALESCKILCDSISEVDDVRQAMLLDVTAPSGQYAKPDSVDIYSIFYTANELVAKPPYMRDSTRYTDGNGNADYVFDNISGKLIKPNQLDSAQFVNNFKTIWADSLLKYHPEYCKLLKYEQYQASLSWDRKQFETTTTYSEAVSNGLLNPTAKSSAPYNMFPSITGNKDPLALFTNEKNSLEARMVNYQGRGISLWAMACLMVKCQDNSSSCYTYYTTASHYFDTTTMCEGDLNAAWDYFKQMYLQEKRAIIDSSINSSCSVPTSTTLANSHHHPNFWGANTALTQFGLGTLSTGDTTSIKDSANTAMNAFYEGNCNAYVSKWVQQLASCNYDADSLRFVIIPQLIQVCKEGSDINHPYGSSSIKPSSTNQFASFEDVINHYNQTHGVTNSYNCNPELIKQPKPYNQQVVYSDKPILSKPDSCECSKINTLYAEYQAQAQDTSFAAFMLRTTNTKISDADLSQLRSLCDTSTSCNFLVSAISLPPALQCYTGDICVPCIKMDSLYALFKLTYPDVVPKYEPGSDDTLVSKNSLFENFMNNRLGFARTAQEYLRFMAVCSIDLPVSGYADETLCTKLAAEIQIFKEQQMPSETPFARGKFTAYFNLKFGVKLTYQQIMNIYDSVCGYRPGDIDEIAGSPLPELDSCGSWQSFLSTFLSYYDTDLIFPKPNPKVAFLAYYNGMVGTLLTQVQLDSIYYSSCADSLKSFSSRFGFSQDTCTHLTDMYNEFSAYHYSLSAMLYPRGSFVDFYNLYWSTNFTYEQVDSVYSVVCASNLEAINSDFQVESLEDCDTWDDIVQEFQNSYFPNLVNPPLCSTSFETFFNSYMATQYNYIEIDSIFRLSCNELEVCGNALVNELSASDFCLWMHSEVIPDFLSYYNSLSIPKPSKRSAFAIFYNSYSGQSSFGPDLTFDNINRLFKKFCNDSLNFSEEYTGAYLCGKSEVVFPPLEIGDITNCSDSTIFSVSSGTELFKDYVDSLKSTFENEYLAKCMKAYELESFTVTRTNSLYHYTLYYYDQTGNLVKTVPPQGVQVDFSGTWLNSVKAARTSGADLLPTHSLVTQYRYNTLNQVTAQNTPDAGTSNFWYDRLGRLVVSQNAKQLIHGAYSNTTYDELGRISEVGEIAASTMTDSISRKAVALGNWMSSGTKTQITKTIYDIPYEPLTPVMAAKNLRNRVAWTAYYENQDSLSLSGHSTASFYTYDIHGNVDTLIQDYRKVSTDISDTRNRFKKMVYQYDLVSGKVNHVAYQPKEPDAFYHKYYYDAENRITNVETSQDSIYWENEAFYKYYRHGPLARTVLGQQQVQATDYAYTIQGWLKGVNSSALNPLLDMGADGTNLNVARDAYSFSLYYFGNRDYTPISGTNPFAYVDVDNVPDNHFKPLFNGNIAAMSTHLPDVTIEEEKHLINFYTYDQLNRLVGMNVYKGFDNNENTWSLTALDAFKELISYDANGNILTYNRNGNSSETSMDDMTYHYIPGSNKLEYISDNVGHSKYDVDIDDQGSSNYQYDEIGNLISDVQEGIDSITWTVYGKIATIYKSGGDYIKYSYDAGGNRISKFRYSSGITTLYVRDAQGNVMSVYSKGESGINGGDLSQVEIHLYGTSRLGILKPNVNVQRPEERTTVELNEFEDGSEFLFTRGQRYYELSNHLGNVLVSISDKKLGHDDGNGHADYFEADILTATDYAPFGMQLVGRSYQASDYRYGFNGQERSNDIKGEGNSYTAEFWEYDPRSGRRWNIDPVVKHYEGPYTTFSCNPIIYADLYGDDPQKPTATGTSEGQSQTTSETKFVGSAAARGGTWQTKRQTWYWHAGGVQGSEAGWYTSEQYSEVLKPLATVIAVEMKMVSGAGEKVARAGYEVNKKLLEKFVGNGLSDNTTNHLIAAARTFSAERNLSASGFTEPSGFNVEDVLGFGLLARGVSKLLGTIVAKNIVGKETLSALVKNTVDDFVKLFKPNNEYDVAKTLYRGTSGSEGAGNFLFLTDDAAVAATYVKNGGKVMKYEISAYALKNLEQRGMLQMLNDIHMIGGKQVYHNTYKFVGSNIRQALNTIAKPN